MIQIGASPATIDTPIEHLMACHRRIEQRLDTLVNAADHLDRDKLAATSAIAASFHFLDTSGLLHTRDEEDSLFPRLRPKLSAPELEFVDLLEAQHEQAEAIYAELKGLQHRIAESPDDLLRYRDCAERLRDFYQSHIRSEDNILTAISKRLLSDEDLADISTEMRVRRDQKLFSQFIRLF